ncbi:SDR family NAD(P)-dependent oxidoreductase [Spirillospora sp. CA-294931]|uniref:SDR family NAD(P)-dependent oxidoreductase n=1 Tax=Spirillospora sp. CA-294931 TaxID=3240042 RepID=UPI003D8ABC41
MDANVAIYPDLEGKVVVITGGARGAGACTARAFAAQGALVASVGPDERALEDVVALITASGGSAIGVAADVTHPAALFEAASQVKDLLGPVDVLAAFAGGRAASGLTSAFLTIRAFAPDMTRRGAGAILTLSSSTGRGGQDGLVTLATDLGSRGVRLHCLTPAPPEALSPAGIARASLYLASEAAAAHLTVS